MSHDQILENFKESFPPKVEYQLLEMDDIDIAVVKAGGLVLLFKTELWQAASSCTHEKHIKLAQTIKARYIS